MVRLNGEKLREQLEKHLQYLDNAKAQPEQEQSEISEQTVQIDGTSA